MFYLLCRLVTVTGCATLCFSLLLCQSRHPSPVQWGSPSLLASTWRLPNFPGSFCSWDDSWWTSMFRSFFHMTLVCRTGSTKICRATVFCVFSAAVLHVLLIVLFLPRGKRLWHSGCVLTERRLFNGVPVEGQAGQLKHAFVGWAFHKTALSRLSMCQSLWQTPSPGPFPVVDLLSLPIIQLSFDPSSHQINNREKIHLCLKNMHKTL